MSDRPKRGERGVTIAEILVVLAVLGIILLIAIPNFQGMLKAYQVSTSVDQLVSSLERARQLAVTRREVHTMTIQADPTNRWTLTDTVTGKVVQTSSMGPGVAISVAPAAAYSFSTNGACTNPTTYTGTTPTGQYVQIQAPIQGTRVDRYTIEISPVGRVKTTKEHLS